MPSHPTKTPPVVKNFLSRIYLYTTGVVDKFLPNILQPLWNHPTGPKTVFFWCPFLKWGIVLAGFEDIQRPARQISIIQCGALASTGVIWTRYSLVIVPKNYNLFLVNLVVALTQIFQVGRACKYKLKEKNFIG